ncbi:hypothetical protein B0H12DRAFT_1105918 [Mycena haematopus]|nr:hypothetical protein B0H12DRAFT_1105918 [Mycena haematopus]
MTSIFHGQRFLRVKFVCHGITTSREMQSRRGHGPPWQGTAFRAVLNACMSCSVARD